MGMGMIHLRQVGKKPEPPEELPILGGKGAGGVSGEA